jgi:bifunctional non-homologous end joining protein LigD
MADPASPRFTSGGWADPADARDGRAGPVGPGWAFEVKFDGVRAIGYTGWDGLTLYSRNDRDISHSYPEVAALTLKKRLILDGELVALDERGRPDFGLLQQRMHVAAPAAELMGRVPVQFVVFDVLHQGDRSLLELPCSTHVSIKAAPTAQ